MENDFVFILASVGLYLWALRSILFWVHLWQAASYQPTLSAMAGKARRRVWHYAFSPLSFVTFVALAVILVFIVNDQPRLFTLILVVGLLLIKGSIALGDIFLNRLVRPKISFRAVAVVVLSLILFSILFLFPLTEQYFWLLILDRLIFFIVAFFVAVFTFPDELYDDYQIRKAIKRVKRQKLTAVMICGGVEARAAASILSQLVQGYETALVVHSPSDTASSIAGIINKKVTEETTLLIIAVSTKNQPFVAQTAAIVCPSYIVLTEEYRAEQTALPEILASSLARRGKLLLDASWIEDAAISAKNKKKLIFYASTSGDTFAPVQLRAAQVAQNKSLLRFQAVLPTQTLQIQTPLIGQFHVSYLLPLLFLSGKLGVPAKKLQHNMASLMPLPHLLTYHKMPNGVVFLDQTLIFDKGIFQQGIKYLRLFKGRKLLVLGVNVEELSKKDLIWIGKQAGTICSMIMLLQSSWQRLVRKGIKESKGRCRVLYGRDHEIEEYLLETVQKGDVVFFVGGKARTLLETLSNIYSGGL